MRSGVLILAALAAALFFAAGDASACHRGSRSGGCASGGGAGGCASGTCASGGCSGGSCSSGQCVGYWRDLGDGEFAWIDASGRQLGNWRPDTGYRVYLGDGRWEGGLELSRPATRLAGK